MKVGIVVYSQTGNTLSVATKLKEKLAAAGHSVALEQVKLVGERKQGVPTRAVAGCSAVRRSRVRCGGGGVLALCGDDQVPG